MADTKAAIYDALHSDGFAVINADDAFAPFFEQRVLAQRAAGRRIVRFGLEASADISARDIQFDSDRTRFMLTAPAGDINVTLSMPGRHNLRNALAAAGMAIAAGASLQQVRDGLDAVLPVAGRQVSHRLRSGAVLIDDSYNANPGSLDAAIEALAAASSTRHGESAGIARLYAFGPLSAAAVQGFGDGALHFTTHAELTEALIAGLGDGAGIRMLVKGSRGSAMDRIVEHLLQHDAAYGKGEVDAA